MTHLWKIRDRSLTVGLRPLVMGIVNVTPDSFSDGGRHATAEAAVAHALALVGDGADLLDVGGESTRPGSLPVPAEEELARVVPVVAALVRQTNVPISVDTSKAEVARQALAAGAHVVNDVTALGDPALAAAVRDAGAGLVLMHMQGTPATMQQDPRYGDVLDEVRAFLRDRLAFAAAAGIPADAVALDPGIGFGKTREHNLELLRRLDELQGLGRPVCLGVSRKGFLGKLGHGREVHERLPASLAAVCHAVVRGAAQVVRVHDVRETADAVAALEAIAGGGKPG
jgi:dihydropteroate synthase